MSKKPRGTFYDGTPRRWYHDPDFIDSRELRIGVAFTLILGGCLLLLVVLVGAGVGFSMYADRTGCEQKGASRPDIRTEWHWNTGCIILNPGSTVVISR